MKQPALLAVIAALVLTACGEPADVAGTGVVEACAAEDEAGRCQLRRLVTESLDRYVAGAPQSVEAEQVWRMRSGEEYATRFDLIGGEEYFVIGACDRECLDIDLFLRDAAGAQVYDAEGSPLQDILLDRVPVILFTPPEDGAYEVALSMLDCLVEPCYAGVRVMRLVLNPYAEPQFSARLRSGFDDPATFVFEAGGERTWTSVGRRTCSGHFSASPNVAVTYSPSEGAFPLTISAGPADLATSPLDATHDTTLMVYQFETGAWLCDDDAGVGLNPSLTINEPSGRYAIWVGSYQADARPTMRLFISEHISQ